MKNNNSNDKKSKRTSKSSTKKSNQSGNNDNYVNATNNDSSILSTPNSFQSPTPTSTTNIPISPNAPKTRARSPSLKKNQQSNILTKQLHQSKKSNTPIRNRETYSPSPNTIEYTPNLNLTQMTKSIHPSHIYTPQTPEKSPTSTQLTKTRTSPKTSIYTSTTSSQTKTKNNSYDQEVPFNHKTPKSRPTIYEYQNNDDSIDLFGLNHDESSMCDGEDNESRLEFDCRASNNVINNTNTDQYCESKTNTSADDSIAMFGINMTFSSPSPRPIPQQKSKPQFHQQYQEHDDSIDMFGIGDDSSLITPAPKANQPQQQYQENDDSIDMFGVGNDNTFTSPLTKPSHHPPQQQYQENDDSIDMFGIVDHTPIQQNNIQQQYQENDDSIDMFGVGGDDSTFTSPLPQKSNNCQNTIPQQQYQENDDSIDMFGVGDDSTFTSPLPQNPKTQHQQQYQENDDSINMFGVGDDSTFASPLPQKNNNITSQQQYQENDDSVDMFGVGDDSTFTSPLPQNPKTQPQQQYQENDDSIDMFGVGDNSPIPQNNNKITLQQQYQENDDSIDMFGVGDDSAFTSPTTKTKTSISHSNQHEDNDDSIEIFGVRGDTSVFTSPNPVTYQYQENDDSIDMFGVGGDDSTFTSPLPQNPKTQPQQQYQENDDSIDMFGVGDDSTFASPLPQKSNSISPQQQYQENDDSIDMFGVGDDSTFTSPVTRPQQNVPQQQYQENDDSVDMFGVGNMDDSTNIPHPDSFAKTSNNRVEYQDNDDSIDMFGIGLSINTTGITTPPVSNSRPSVHAPSVHAPSVHAAQYQHEDDSIDIFGLDHSSLISPSPKGKSTSTSRVSLAMNQPPRKSAPQQEYQEEDDSVDMFGLIDHSGHFGSPQTEEYKDKDDSIDMFGVGSPDPMQNSFNLEGDRYEGINFRLPAVSSHILAEEEKSDSDNEDPIFNNRFSKVVDVEQSRIRMGTQASLPPPKSYTAYQDNDDSIDMFGIGLSINSTGVSFDSPIQNQDSSVDSFVISRPAQMPSVGDDDSIDMFGINLTMNSFGSFDNSFRSPYGASSLPSSNNSKNPVVSNYQEADDSIDMFSVGNDSLSPGGEDGFMTPPTRPAVNSNTSSTPIQHSKPTPGRLPGGPRPNPASQSSLSSPSRHTPARPTGSSNVMPRPRTTSTSTSSTLNTPVSRPPRPSVASPTSTNLHTPMKKQSVFDRLASPKNRPSTTTSSSRPNTVTSPRQSNASKPPNPSTRSLHPTSPQFNRTSQIASPKHTHNQHVDSSYHSPSTSMFHSDFRPTKDLSLNLSNDSSSSMDVPDESFFENSIGNDMNDDDYYMSADNETLFNHVYTNSDLHLYSEMLIAPANTLTNMLTSLYHASIEAKNRLQHQSHEWLTSLLQQTLQGEMNVREHNKIFKEKRHSSTDEVAGGTINSKPIMSEYSNVDYYSCGENDLNPDDDIVFVPPVVETLPINVQLVHNYVNTHQHHRAAWTADLGISGISGNSTNNRNTISNPYFHRNGTENNVFNIDTDPSDTIINNPNIGRVQVDAVKHNNTFENQVNLIGFTHDLYLPKQYEYVCTCVNKLNVNNVTRLGTTFLQLEVNEDHSPTNNTRNAHGKRTFTDSMLNKISVKTRKTDQGPSKRESSVKYSIQKPFVYSSNGYIFTPYSTIYDTTEHTHITNLRGTSNKVMNRASDKGKPKSGKFSSLRSTSNKSMIDDIINTSMNTTMAFSQQIGKANSAQNANIFPSSRVSSIPSCLQTYLYIYTKYLTIMNTNKNRSERAANPAGSKADLSGGDLVAIMNKMHACVLESLLQNNTRDVFKNGTNLSLDIDRYPVVCPHLLSLHALLMASFNSHPLQLPNAIHPPRCNPMVHQLLSLAVNISPYNWNAWSILSANINSRKTLYSIVFPQHWMTRWGIAEALCKLGGVDISLHPVTPNISTSSVPATSYIGGLSNDGAIALHASLHGVSMPSDLFQILISLSRDFSNTNNYVSLLLRTILQLTGESSDYILKHDITPLLQDSLLLDPYNRHILPILANFYVYNQDINELTQLVRIAVQYHNYSYESWYCLGLLNMVNTHWLQAQQCFLRCISLATNTPMSEIHRKNHHYQYQNSTSTSHINSLVSNSSNSCMTVCPAPSLLIAKCRVALGDTSGATQWAINVSSNTYSNPYLNEVSGPSAGVPSQGSISHNTVTNNNINTGAFILLAKIMEAKKLYTHALFWYKRASAGGINRSNSINTQSTISADIERVESLLKPKNIVKRNRFQ